MIIVITGKGGVGKTMVSSLLVRCIAELKKDAKILAIDADPATNLADALGIKALMSIGEIIENFNVENSKNINFLDYLRQKISENTTHTEKSDFIEMGQGEGVGCYCSVNDVLRFVLEEKQKNYKFVIVDCAAGLEHLSRKTTTGADVLLIVTDTSEAGFRSAETIKKIAVHAGVEEDSMFLVVNKVKEAREVRKVNTGSEKTEKVKTGSEILNEKIANTKILEICRIPYDEKVIVYNNSGTPLINIPSNSKTYPRIKELAEFLAG
ncbi:MAG: AAA family ATPase [Candidatus Altiarchaeum hamiconexum]|uniref:AAA family ATPase n=1 Tax=Candidatus Altarchaeum hamiconexum TaxID=1803513 RepID=A0A8J7YV78_9ARCH|nr:AAA family ATPase [Candidatus Altarchaeum hamiconexum]OIQ05000.1 MAG: hypothetical protein AUK59_05550 [Candidatus Altarchaeum sp. CG2_30_32_3053]PIN67808.1 MAG: ATP-binding protein [Candidatus Altarchaeum sp. CG12_big_fil_rev_8_21_14_0_65_33_22]PIV28751.1 MAG: ATP-binding protein [Candidatus Altarchaeum sp. CG03_land_8_20_14_0_80_32_618]PIX48271.1 MAG: ATP-binding protein [Candidatus Altarchaeum sp. CG_4_8_14_3_um_filter_33_2054]PIZ32847.1 MAG: ATP-binding protein [Candidatus Altarchaeum s